MLFAADIHANICFGTPGATEEEVREAARAANAATFIERLPEGYHTQVRCVCSPGSGGSCKHVGRTMLMSTSISTMAHRAGQASL